MKNAYPENFHKVLQKGRPRNSSLIAFEIITFQLYEKKKIMHGEFAQELFKIIKTAAFQGQHASEAVLRIGWSRFE